MREIKQLPKMATTRTTALDRFLVAPALPPRTLGRSGGGWTNEEVVVAVCGARGVHAVDDALYDAVSLRYERKVRTFADAFRACLGGRQSVARLDLETLRECHPAFAALQMPEWVTDQQTAAELGEWFARQAAEIETDMGSKQEQTVAAKRPPKITPLVAEDPGALLAANVEVARGIVEMCQAIRDASHSALDCYLCRKPTVMGYVLGGRVCCRACRGEHRERYYAERGETAPPRRARGRARRMVVRELHVEAERCTVAAAS